MKIASVAYSVPSWKVDNDTLLRFIDNCNPNVSVFKKKHYLKIVNKLLKQTGALTRHWRDPNGDQKASTLILEAMTKALSQANLIASDIDLLIYCGVGRGFLEPANAYFYANAMGMHRTNCFDITDACMSWIRATQVAQLMMNSQAFNRVMIINGEFHLGFHDNWEIRDVKNLEYSFPMYTIGEAATATILEPEGKDWSFTYSSKTEFSNLCTIPLPSYKNFVESNDKIGLNGTHRFVSFGREMFKEGAICLGELIRSVIRDADQNVLYFPHAPSKAIYEDTMPQYGIPADKLYLEVYPNFGNLVSASIPVGLSRAAQEGKIISGDPIALIPASAGIVSSVVQLTF